MQTEQNALLKAYPPPEYVFETFDGKAVVYFKGTWDIGTMAEGTKLLKKLLYALQKQKVTYVTYCLDYIKNIDSAGVLLFIQHEKTLEPHIKLTLEIPPHIEKLYYQISASYVEPQPAVVLPSVLLFLANIGKWLETTLVLYKNLITFLGYVLFLLVKSFFSPRSFRWVSTIYHMEHIGIKAIPIITLLSFLVGTVLAYMSAAAFKRFGAQVYIVNLLDIAILRELGVLLTAILISGRTSASCTASIGSMVNNEEIASMRVIGLNPVEFLVLPRLVALLCMFPLLTMVSNVAGMVGGMLASWFAFDITPATFWSLFTDATSLTSFFLGLGKSPIFALIITTVGCFYGFQASGKSDEVGILTTESVVQSLFLCILFDAFFALLYSRLGL